MAEFMRARSDEQKALRIEEIKAAAKRQFDTRPYHEITLTTIADELSWSRANLYKYISTKEEIFLELETDEMQAYFDALLTALPEACGFTPEVLVEVWAGIANAHQTYFRLGEILSAIIETNVELDRLVAFKRVYYQNLDAFARRLAALMRQDSEGASCLSDLKRLVTAVYFHGVGMVSACLTSQHVKEALTVLNISDPHADFRTEMRDFIRIMLAASA